MNDKFINRDNISSSIDELHNASILVDSREIFIHGHIGDSYEDGGVDYRMAIKFIKNLRFLTHLNDKPIIIHQHSIGGGWNEGIMIYDSIKSCELYIIFITHGIAASMGSIIPQAADLRLSMPNCDWLIHHGTTGIHPELLRRQAKSWGNWEDRLDLKMIDIFAPKCLEADKYSGKSMIQMRNILNKKLSNSIDWWLSAEESLENGFIDGIYGTEEYKDIVTIEKEFGY